MNYYTNQAYASGRLEGTVVNTIDGEPVYIEQVKEYEYVVRVLSTLDLAKFTPDKIDLTPVKLGWCNTGDSSFYISRVPIRKWKQGLHPENMAIDNVHHREKPMPFSWVSPDLHKTIKGIYPSYQAAVKEKYAKKRAFARHWALDKEGSLWYKARTVGIIVDEVPVLNDSDSYLRGLFERHVGVECAYS